MKYNSNHSLMNFHANSIYSILGTNVATSWQYSWCCPTSANVSEQITEGVVGSIALPLTTTTTTTINNTASTDCPPPPTITTPSTSPSNHIVPPLPSNVNQHHQTTMTPLSVYYVEMSDDESCWAERRYMVCEKHDTKQHYGYNRGILANTKSMRNGD